MRHVLSLLAATAAFLALPASGCRPHDGYAATQSGPLAGAVSDVGGAPVAGAFVTARSATRPVAVTVLTDARGRWRLAGLEPGAWRVGARRDGYASPPEREVAVADRPLNGLDFALQPGAATPPAELGASAWLGLLPAGEEKRRFALDCTGCHTFDAQVALVGGTPRARAEWEDAVGKMLSFAGATTGFPVISEHRDPAKTAEWLAAHVTAAPRGNPAVPPEVLGRAVLTEYTYPHARDLPHDVAVDAQGQVVITGMFTHRMLRLDPAAATFAEVPIPQQGANPRAVEVDPEGRWWVLLGGPKKLAVYAPASGEWTLHDIGMYPHSIGRDARGRVWFNGHFTKDPEQIGYLDPGTGRVHLFTVPRHPTRATGGGPIPYDLQVAPDGRVWGSELQGNRIFAYDPDAGRFEVFDLPTPESGPRRMDFDARGVLWIPEYANNTLTRFDPATKRFRQYPLPVPDALPYVVRVDRARNRVWIGTGAADAVVSFDPAAERFAVHPLPTRGALVRHMAVDPRTGDLWAAYGASPGIAPRILRVRMEPPGGAR